MPPLPALPGESLFSCSVPTDDHCAQRALPYKGQGQAREKPLGELKSCILHTEHILQAFSNQQRHLVTGMFTNL